MTVGGSWATRAMARRGSSVGITAITRGASPRLAAAIAALAPFTLILDGEVVIFDASPYVGGRTLSWLKVKQRNYRAAARGVQSRSRYRR